MAPKSQNTNTDYTNTTPIMPWCSFKIKPRTERAKKGMAPLVLQMFIQKQKLVLDLGITVQVDQWNAPAQNLKGKSTEATNANILIDDIKSSIHNIQLDHRLQGRIMTKDSFVDAFLNRQSRNCFLEYFRKELHARYSAGVIMDSTFRAQRNVLRRLEVFYKTMPFAEIDATKLEEVRRKLLHYLKEHDLKSGDEENYHTNTVWDHFKTMKTYIRLAQNSGINISNPFTNFKIPRGSGRIIFLTEAELNVCRQAWRLQQFTGSEHYALTILMWASYSSMRISDIKKLHTDDVVDDHIILRPQKSRRQNKTVRIPLNAVTRQILQGVDGKVFTGLTEQKINQQLKFVMKILGIKKNVTIHVGRHTFATEFLRRGGQLHVLQKIMGHSDIKTTMIYAHLHDQHVTTQMGLMDD